MAVILCDELVESWWDNLVQLGLCLLPEHLAASSLVAREEYDKTVKMVVAIAPIHRWAFADVLQNVAILLVIEVGHGADF